MGDSTHSVGVSHDHTIRPSPLHVFTYDDWGTGSAPSHTHGNTGGTWSEGTDSTTFDFNDKPLGVKWEPIDELPYKTKSDGYCVFRDGRLWWFGLGEMDNEPPVSIQSTLQAETDVFLRGA